MEITGRMEGGKEGVETVGVKDGKDWKIRKRIK